MLSKKPGRTYYCILVRDILLWKNRLTDEKVKVILKKLLTLS
jgi:hypothetical protein